MSKSYTEMEAWGIFVGALIIGIVLTSIFWAFITKPKTEVQDEKSLEKNNESITVMVPEEFLKTCNKMRGEPKWDNSGFRQCSIEDFTDKDIISMNLLCKRYNLSLTYGSFGVKCEGKA